MILNDEMASLQQSGAYAFEEIVIGSTMTVVVFPDGRRNIMPYASSEIRYGRPWTVFTQDLPILSALTGNDAIEIAVALYECVHAAVPGVRFEMDAFAKTSDRPVRFKSRAGQLTVRGGFPIEIAGVAAEADRIISAFSAAQKAIDVEMASWKTTTMDACYVTIAAGLSELDGDAFFERIKRDPAEIVGIVGDQGEAVASSGCKEVILPGGLIVRVQGRTVTATVKTKGYTFDACRLTVKNAPQPPETVLCAIRGQPLDALIKVPGLDGSDLTISKIKVVPAGKKLQMTVHLAPQPLRMDDARALYDRVQARGAHATI